jgi:uncharacterized protein (DUF2461 family)
MFTRLPRGYAAGDPAERWLRHLSLVGERAGADVEVTGPALPDILAEDLAALTPLVRWLNGVVGDPPVRSR